MRMLQAISGQRRKSMRPKTPLTLFCIKLNFSLSLSTPSEGSCFPTTIMPILEVSNEMYFFDYRF